MPNDMSSWPPPFQPNAQLTVTLEAQEWNVVFGALNEMPRRISDPVFLKILGQIQRTAQTVEGSDVSH